MQSWFKVQPQVDFFQVKLNFLIVMHSLLVLFLSLTISRLIRTNTCPYNGNRNDACDCVEEGHPDAGLSTFNKVRVLLPNLEVVSK